MKVAFGLKAHSGWAVLVVLGVEAGEVHIVERTRLELVNPEEAVWAKQPYHAAEHLARDEAGVLVDRGIASAHRLALREMESAVKRIGKLGYAISACAVLMGEPMPAWSTDEILSVHFRMHKAEGALYRDALARAAKACRVRVVAIPEKSLSKWGDRAFGERSNEMRNQLEAMKKAIGPPWGKDQKDAAVAALIALLG
jgi:hypothetical protein